MVLGQIQVGEEADQVVDHVGQVVQLEVLAQLADLLHHLRLQVELFQHFPRLRDRLGLG